MDINQPIHNIEYLCRICLQEFPDIDNYFINFDTNLEESDNISYLQVFQLLTGFLVKDNEPQKICLQCKIKVESAYDLKKLAGITQQILEETLTKIEVTEVKVEVDLDVESPEIQDFSDDDNKEDFFNSDSEYNPPVKVEKEAPKGKSYKCEYCDKDFQTYSGMFTHFKRIHPKLRNVRCEFCARRFYFEVQLKKHLSTCKKNKTYKPFDYKKYRAKYKQKIVCPVCGILADKSHMKIHEKRTEKDATINQEPCICDICGTTLQNRYGMIKHMKYQHLGHKVKCKDCENVFLSPSELQKHIRKMHKYVPREYHCRFCPFTTMKEHALRIHRKTHKEVRIFKCHYILK
uniref:CSON001756 protein n=1 Tax=Culicoides sonorensis TaxID=179676 RepID=A0A336LRA4_CULSO